MSKATNLVIVESPSKAKTIGKYLGPDYIVKASMGHLRDLPKSKMGVDLESDFTPQYIPVKGKEELIKELKKDAAAVDTVYLATDPDREGEAISWHLKELLQLPDPPSREGYSFTGWYKDSACYEIWNADTDTIQSDMTLYAGWQKLQ